MPDILHIGPQEIDALEKRGRYGVCVIGCKRLGMLYAVAFAEAGFRTTCVDADQSLVKNLTKGRRASSEHELETRLRGHIQSGMLTVTSDLTSAVAQSDIVILTATVKVDEKKNLDSSEIQNHCRQVGAAIRQGTLVVYAGVTGLGFTEEVVKETLESTSGLKAGQGFGLAYVHSRNGESKGSTEAIGNQELMVAARDQASLDSASLLLSTVSKKGIKRTFNVRAAELATLFSLVKKDVLTALTNELAIFSESAEMDYFEALELMDLGFEESVSAPTIDGEGNKLGTSLLLENAENLGVKLRLPGLARQINEGMVRHAVGLTQAALRKGGKTLRRSRIAVLGETRTGTSGESFVKMLKAKGARINLYDPRGERMEEQDPACVSKRSVVEAIENSDCIVLLSDVEQFKRLNLKSLRSVMKTPAAVVDLAGVFEPERVESEGFIYRGLGRGFEKE